MCSWHQHRSSGRSAWCVIRVTQLCHISQVCRQSARDARLVALTAAHTSSDLSLTNIVWIQWVLAHAVCVYVSQIASQCSKSPSLAVLEMEPSRAVCVHCSCR